MSIQEFQHFDEFQLIETMNLKMQKIRLQSTANVTQTRSAGSLESV
jgi:hypothetical protein